MPSSFLGFWLYTRRKSIFNIAFPGRTVLDPFPMCPVLKPQIVYVGSIRFFFSASLLGFALRNFFSPHSFRRLSPLNGILLTSFDWAGVNGSTSSYHPLIKIFPSGLFIVFKAQTRRHAGLSTSGA